jgi:hypothetical protein
MCIKQWNDRYYKNESIYLLRDYDFRKTNRFISQVTHFTSLSLLQQTRHNRYTSYLRCDKNFPVACPDPSQPGIGHLSSVQITKKPIVTITKVYEVTNEFIIQKSKVVLIILLIYIILKFLLKCFVLRWCGNGKAIRITNT